MDGAAIQVLIEKHGNTLGGLLVRKDPISKRNMMLITIFTCVVALIMTSMEFVDDVNCKIKWIALSRLKAVKSEQMGRQQGCPVLHAGDLSGAGQRTTPR